MVPIYITFPQGAAVNGNNVTLNFTVINNTDTPATAEDKESEEEVFCICNSRFGARCFPYCDKYFLQKIQQTNER